MKNQRVLIILKKVFSFSFYESWKHSSFWLAERIFEKVLNELVIKCVIRSNKNWFFREIGKVWIFCTKYPIWQQVRWFSFIAICLKLVTNNFHQIDWKVILWKAMNFARYDRCINFKKLLKIKLFQRKTYFIFYKKCCYSLILGTVWLMDTNDCV